MRSPLVLALIAAACSSGASHPGDGAAGTGGGGTGGVPGDPCGAPLNQATFCSPTFDQQVTDNPCDAADATAATCGSYKTWTMTIIGSQTCVYNAAGTTLVGARECGAPPPACTCTDFGLDPAVYAACTSATGTRACPP